MSNVYFNSLSGMMAASFGLKSVSNNVSNMQTRGYKGESAFYSAMGGNNSRYECMGGYGSSGNGVSVGGSQHNFSQGDLESGNSNSQLAISGDGLFILKMKNGEYCYTRDGEFHFNNDGFLIDDHTDAFVMGYGVNGQLAKISKNGPDSYPGEATDQVDLQGNIYAEDYVVSDDDKTNDPDPPLFKDIEVKNITVFDDKGEAHELTLTFKIDGRENNGNRTPEQLILKSVSENGKVLFDNPFPNGFDYTIRYGYSSYPDADKHTITFDLKFKGCDSQSIKLNFRSGENPGQMVQLEHHDKVSETKVESINQSGYGKGKLYDYQFDKKGLLHYLYTNGQSSEGTHVALAMFDDPQANLVATSNSAFKARSKQGIRYGHADEEGYGAIMQGKLERSNVDSTHEFANIIILQRMFQACSQIMDIDKQLLEQMEKQ